MNKSAVVIVPTIGKPELKQCLTSIINQDYDNTFCYLVVDGLENVTKVVDIINWLESEGSDISKIRATILPNNVGKDGWYGHRVYASFPFLVDEDYVFFLDEDNCFDTHHVSSMIKTCLDNNVEWCYSLRSIHDKDMTFLCEDNCESLGSWNPFTDYKHIDTNCYCLSLNVARQFSPAIFGKWGADRQFYNVLDQHGPNYVCSGEYTVLYRLGGNDGSVKKEFFEYGNSIVAKKYDKFPWKK